MASRKQESFKDQAASNGDTLEQLNYLRGKVEDLSSLIEVSIIINSTVQLDELIGLVMEKAQTVMKAEASSVMLINEAEKVLECKLALGEVGEQVQETMRLKMGEGIAGWVAEHGEPQIVADVNQDSRFASRVDDSTGFQTRSILAAPLKVVDRVIGVAEVINRRDGKAFDNEDLQLFSTFCRQVAMAIENVRMYEVELQKQRLEQQLEAAKFIQESFMPESFPCTEKQKFSLWAKSIPAATIGGDFFDFVEFDHRSLGVAVGDVTGKGIPAALYMARLVSDFRMNSQLHQYPSDVLSSLNQLLVERSRRGMFVTFQYGLLDSETGEFKYANAGHIPFIRYNPASSKVEFLSEAKSVPLGILPDLDLSECTIQLDKGDVIVSLTDGIVEAKSKNDEAYSLQRVTDLLPSDWKSVEELVNSIIHDVQEFASGTEQFDDLTVLALKWH